MTKCKAYTREGKPCQNFVGKGRKMYCARHSTDSKSKMTKYTKNKGVGIKQKVYRFPRVQKGG